MTIVIDLGDENAYANLKTDIADWLARSDLSDAVLDKIIDLGESRINRVLRTRGQEYPYFRALDSDGKAPVPASFREFRDMFLYRGVGSDDVLPDLSNVLTLPVLRTSSDVAFSGFAGSSASGVNVTRVGGYFYVSGKPVGAYSLGGTYFGAFEALSDAVRTNWLTDNAPDLILCACLTEGAAYIKAFDQSQYWGERFDAALEELQLQEDKEPYSGARVVMRHGVVGA